VLLLLLVSVRMLYVVEDDEIIVGVEQEQLSLRYMKLDVSWQNCFEYFFIFIFFIILKFELMQLACNVATISDSMVKVCYGEGELLVFFASVPQW
jgi:hypothetical protein